MAIHKSKVMPLSAPILWSRGAIGENGRSQDGVIETGECSRAGLFRGELHLLGIQETSLMF